jgi:hypothetical protein
MTLIEALEKEAVPEIREPLLGVVETVLSKVFIYKTIVRKIYKHESNFIGDFGDFDFRKSFYADDFAWNQAMSPLIYRSLKALKENDGAWVYCDAVSAEDYLIEMNRIDASRDLVRVASEGKLTNEMVLHSWSELYRRTRALTEQQRILLPEFKSTWLDLWRRRLEEIAPWCEMSGDPVLRSEVDGIISEVRVTLDNPYIKDFDSKLLQVQIDNQACNMIFDGDKVLFIDIFLMKQYWRVGDPFLTVSRLAVDVAVLDGTGKEKMLRSEAEKQLWALPDRIYWSYMIYSALIMAPYFYMLKKPEIAGKYVAFIHAHLDKVR